MWSSRWQLSAHRRHEWFPTSAFCPPACLQAPRHHHHQFIKSDRRGCSRIGRGIVVVTSTQIRRLGGHGSESHKQMQVGELPEALARELASNNVVRRLAPAETRDSSKDRTVNVEAPAETSGKVHVPSACRAIEGASKFQNSQLSCAIIGVTTRVLSLDNEYL